MKCVKRGASVASFLWVSSKIVENVNAFPISYSRKVSQSNPLWRDYSSASVPKQCQNKNDPLYISKYTFSNFYPYFKTTRIRSSQTHLHMNWFKDLTTSLFLDGGAYDAGVDYSQLNHPGPELASAALSGQVLTHSIRDASLDIATFAGGCFWGLELAYQRQHGVVHTVVGYTGGIKKEPSYDAVSTGSTGHKEAVVVYYDPNETSYEDLVKVFLDRVDVTTVGGQGKDIGSQYCTAIYYHTEDQKVVAQRKLGEISESLSSTSSKGEAIATELSAAQIFWPAEKYHQQYLERGGRTGAPQSAEKGNTDTIRCYG
uniref:peptide-methionine (S)-S-oxide reductase n=1 Tax=Helicotheca tamesis TaxID=374047 RepID=A0A7S2I7X1_9STRA|mmetsp:Transcript_6475/g.8760  ORF Transcript_6475/g.8760 Transcript_6475/m.8760 type:complete len:315 (+) Transcript_6475:108-1052(+)|eukprot:CAMPEP_0185740582 /NCGR_PEP_ID=MMETSP1171-20130828/38107_1 /TAXON_ID=374046 /ORGANISM="Helicotheca tamensis, Strain CCMP826" /LENGTH=314 /DNA_ID=CAMNT_0028412459 /DNA_START=55 /DNA_END=999 /DNA_ORIENTATION=-